MKLLGLSLAAALSPALVSADLAWKSVPDSKQLETATHVVPLDWADHSVGNATLAVMRYRSTGKPHLGSIFVNPGGPGESGLDMVSGLGQSLSEYTGGQYDIVSWDPRGVGATTPLVTCFESLAAEKAFWKGTVPDAGLEAKGNFTSQDDLDAFYAQADEVDSLLTELGKRCNQLSGGILPYVGTAAAVRDMVSLADAIEGKELINYWGFSYGTIIGSYFVNMFPNRVGRVIIDGVVDPIYWANLPSYKTWGDCITSAEDTFAGFTQACALAGYPSCALGNVGGAHTSPADISNWIHQLIDDAYDYKKQGGDIGSSDIRSYTLSEMYRPTEWPSLAQNLLDMYTQVKTGNAPSTPRPRFKFHRRDSTDPSTTPTPDPDPTTQPAPSYAFQAITCADAIDSENATTKDVFDEIVRVSRVISPLFGPSFGDAGFYCHRWGARAVERFTGPWNHTLSNPILVIGNEADPITPFANAKVVADLLGDSAVIIQQDDFGHSSLAERSNCTIAVVTEYFSHGKLPVENSMCGTNQILFPAIPVTKNTLASAAASASTPISSDADELNKLRQKNRILVAIDIALCALVLVLLAALVFNFIRSRKARAGAARSAKYDTAPAAMLKKDDFEGSSYGYTTPYDAPPARR
ncbi:hypothetical protein BOTBODRAFT_30137 [Botryobasidium botryosum FD-172 SS1]|uniref:Peptidase S33 tripeptidyl aminopeptidase-like C-terminal domain-containing protein n=1 Tax=Botryobasidium botryosum (strain FD-172 SS1) TaxID=930990 RepID=A0A067N0Q5_BOTB1|nr:hypothetical protein BOTBODRAFT_30137 [Botryobasidium botryosum FD-172 SS1]